MEPQGVSDDSQVLSVKLIQRESERETEKQSPMLFSSNSLEGF